MPETVNRVILHDDNLIDILKREKVAAGFTTFVRAAEVLIREAAERRAIERAKQEAAETAA